MSSSNADALKRAGQEAQLIANRKNEFLRNLKLDYFYEDAFHDSGLYSGGRLKFYAILAAKPPIELENPASPSANLLTELFKLLQRHYQTMKFDELRPLLASPKSVPNWPSPQIEENEEEQEFAAAYETFGVERGERRNRRSTSTSRRSSSTSTSSSTGRPLDNHRDILDIFMSVLEDENGRKLKVTPFRDDRLYDQFDGNQVVKSTDIGDPSNEKKTNSKSKKRNAEEAELESDPRPLRRSKRKPPPKKTVSHGMQVDLRSVISSDTEDDS